MKQAWIEVYSVPSNKLLAVELAETHDGLGRIRRALDEYVCTWDAEQAPPEEVYCRLVTLDGELLNSALVEIRGARTWYPGCSVRLGVLVRP